MSIHCPAIACAPWTAELSGTHDVPDAMGAITVTVAAAPLRSLRAGVPSALESLTLATRGLTESAAEGAWCECSAGPCCATRVDGRTVAAVIRPEMSAARCAARPHRRITVSRG